MFVSGIRSTNNSKGDRKGAIRKSSSENPTRNGEGFLKVPNSGINKESEMAFCSNDRIMKGIEKFVHKEILALL